MVFCGYQIFWGGNQLGNHQGNHAGGQNDLVKKQWMYDPVLMGE